MPSDPVFGTTTAPHAPFVTVRPGRRRLSFFVALAALGIFRVFHYVAHFGSDVPTGDDWDLLRTLLAWRTDGITTASLFAFHNEHRIVATRLVYAVLLPRAEGNMRIALLFDAALVASTLVALLSFLLREKVHPVFAGASAIAVTALVTGWFQWQNLLWSFQLPWMLMPLMLVASVWLLCYVKDSRLCAAGVGLCLVVALACQANGIVTWLAVIPPLLLRCRALGPRRLIAIAAACLLVVAIVGAAYAWGMPSYVKRPSVAAVFDDPGRFVHFFLAALGSPVSAALSLAGPERWVGTTAGAFAGVVALVLLIAIARRGWRERASPVFALGLSTMIFGATSVAAITLGRFVDFSPDQIESRYSTFALYFHVGLLLTALAVCARERPVGTATGTLRSVFLLGCLAVGIGGAWGDSVLEAHGMNMKLAQLRVRAKLDVAAALPDEPSLAGAAHTVPVGQIPSLLASLRLRHLWSRPIMGSRPATDLQTSEATGNVDASTSTAGDVILTGWARLPDNRPADAVLALAAEPHALLVPVAISAEERLARPDIAEKFGDRFLVSAGWRLAIKRADAALRPRIAAYSAADGGLYEIPIDWSVVAH